MNQTTTTPTTDQTPDQTPAQQIIACLSACEDAMQHRTCSDRAPDERLPEYATRVLRYAITYGIAPLTLSQLELADATAQGCVASLPQTLTQDARRHDQALHALRLRMQARIAAKRAQLAQVQRLIDACDLETQTAANAPQPDQDAPEMTDQERALTLLRAALTLIMQPPGSPDGNGGHGARLIPPTPNRPPGSNAQQPPPPSAPAAGPRRF
jgi:hypothetical protein